MEFPWEYFEDEVREGFFVSGMMKREWAANLKLLGQIDDLCKRHGIKWYADCGTLLGAVRHGGYIPWDDDIDISMMRDDFERFLVYANEELPEEYYVTDCHNRDYSSLLGSVTNGDYIRMDTEHLSSWYGLPFSASVDIFPLDFVSPDPDVEEQRATLTRDVFSVAQLSDIDDHTPSEHTLSLVRKIEAATDVSFSSLRPLSEQLFEVAFHLSCLYSRENSTEVVLMPNWLENRDHKYKLEWFKETVELPFETGTISCPAVYDAVLRTEYGANYMQPVHGGGMHTYPCYIESERRLRERLGSDYPFLYAFNKKDLLPVEKKSGESLKKRLCAFEDMLAQAENLMKESMIKGDTSSLFLILQKSQEFAIQMGTMIENDSRENSPTVRLLEEYCEILWEIHENPSSNVELFSHLSRKHQTIKKSIADDIIPMTEKVFLLWKSSSFALIESFYRKASEDPLCNAILVSVPYYEKKPDGSLGDIHDEVNLYPKELGVKKWDEYSIDKRLPDEIFITNPYDQYCLSSTINPFFYAKNLRQYTKKLTYIPYFEVDEIDSSDERAMHSLGLFSRLPGLIYADEIVVFSENMRERQIDSLTDFAGKDTRPVWEEKIKVSLLKEKDHIKDESKDIPKDWEKILKKPDGGYKKAILYYTCISTLIEHGENAISKITDVFDTFRDQKENIALIWRPDGSADIIKKYDLSLWEKYSKTVAQFKKEGWAIYDDTYDIERTSSVCDAYYGDPGNMVRFFREAKKPIMLQDISIK
mgnify:CR=1 FL=1